MPRTNYVQLRRQKEAARKARQQDKLERRNSRAGDAGAQPAGTATDQARKSEP